MIQMSYGVLGRCEIISLQRIAIYIKVKLLRRGLKMRLR